MSSESRLQESIERKEDSGFYETENTLNILNGINTGEMGLDPENEDLIMSMGDNPSEEGNLEQIRSSLPIPTEITSELSPESIITLAAVIAVMNELTQNNAEIDQPRKEYLEEQLLRLMSPVQEIANQFQHPVHEILPQLNPFSQDGDQKVSKIYQMYTSQITSSREKNRNQAPSHTRQQGQ